MRRERLLRAKIWTFGVFVVECLKVRGASVQKKAENVKSRRRISNLRGDIDLEEKGKGMMDERRINDNDNDNITTKCY